MSKLMNTHTFTALITPFDAGGAIDFKSLDRLVNEQVQAGNGIVLLGSTGEGLALSHGEKCAILRHVAAQKLPVPVLAGVGGFNLEQTLAFLSDCENLPLDGYLMVTPIYSRPGPVGQTAWFRELLDFVSRPCMLYNVPARAGCSLELDVLKHLHEHPNCWALKEASGSIETFRAYRKAAPGLALYCGNDDLLPALTQEGATGLVSVMGNAWPQATHAYVERSLAQEEIDFQTLLPAIRCVNARNPVSVKIMAHALKLITEPLLRAPLALEDGSAPEELMRRHLEVQNWMQAHGELAPCNN